MKPTESRLCFRHSRDFFIQRIINRFFIFESLGYKVKFTQPSKKILYNSTIEYTNFIEENINKDILVDQDIIDILISEHEWNLDKENFVEGYHDKIADLKIQLFQSYLNTKRQREIREEIKEQKEKYDDLYSIRHQYDHLTLEGMASYQKMLYIIDRCCKVESGYYISSRNLLSDYYNNCMTDDFYRNLSQNEPWASLWALSSKDSYVFGVSSCDLSEEQIRLMSWSRVYDNIKESPECPNPDVFEDNDMIDGWLSLQRREREKKSLTAVGERQISGSKVSRHQQVFLFAKSKEDAEKISKMNSNSANIEKSMRIGQIRKAKKIEIGYRGQE